MPQLTPIPAIHYPFGRDLTTKIAPPYDVLDEGPKRELLSRDPQNIVAVDLPVTPPKTVGPDAVYESAGGLFRGWLESGVLMRDDEPSLFAYEQAFKVNGEPRTRRGLFANLAVEEFNRPGGGIFRHEHTFRGGTDDRLKLMRATRAQLSPVFGVYDDPDNVVSGLLKRLFTPKHDATGSTRTDGVEHRLWAIRDARLIQKLADFFEPTSVYIADGHHRYTTAMNYQREQPRQPAAGTCLFVLVAANDPGLAVLPTHRVLCGLRGFDVERLERLLRHTGKFIVRRTPHGHDDLAGLAQQLPRFGPHAVGLYDPATGLTHAVWTVDGDPLASLLPDQPPVWRALDVAIFHELMVDRTLRPAFGGDSITYKYPHELPDLARIAHESPDRLAVILQATPFNSVRDVSLAGGVMPPKSTFFYPKVATGLVINPLD